MYIKGCNVRLLSFCIFGLPGLITIFAIEDAGSFIIVLILNLIGIPSLISLVKHYKLYKNVLLKLEEIEKTRDLTFSEKRKRENVQELLGVCYFWYKLTAKFSNLK